VNGRSDALSPQHRELLTAIADRILPAESGGPTASDAHVVEYIAGQLAGPWGSGARMYRAAPFEQPDHHGHGWQLALTPAEVYASGLEAIDRHVRELYGQALATLEACEQDAILRAWAGGEIAGFGEVDPAGFFEMVRQNVIEGLLCDPIYGGNHDLAGWRWIGHPGAADAHGTYEALIERHGEPLGKEPRGLGAGRQRSQP
jgi:gluconate 2-dehydrogenase gamma chain